MWLHLSTLAPTLSQKNPSMLLRLYGVQRVKSFLHVERKGTIEKTFAQ